MFSFFDLIFPPRDDEKLLRTTTIDTFLASLSPLLVPYTRPGSVTLLPFSTPCVRAAIHEAKYHGSPRAFQYLGAALAEYLRDLEDYEHRTSVLIPIPLGKGRHKERGFNQVEEVIRSALRSLGEDRKRFSLVSDLLERTRETPSQVSLPREEREKNMHGAFQARKALDPAATYLVIDDVLTTGATLQAAIDALREAGATEITPLALAH